MAASVKKYFTCANSAQGFVNFFASSLAGMERIYILKGGPGTGKSTLMKRVGQHFLDKGEDVEYIYCSSDSNSLDGVIITGRKAAIVDGTSPHVVEPQAPGAVEEYVNLGDAWDGDKIRPYKQEILSIKEQISGYYDKVYRLLKAAKAVHDEWEQVYISHTDYDVLNQLSEELCEKILGARQGGQAGTRRDRFFGATTPGGSVNYIENLTEDLEKRYFIKGRPGTGKSTLLKKLAARAQKQGFDTEVYHCSFDPDSLDMVVIRALGLCVFDATAPHELFPSRVGDETVDLYQAAVEPETDEQNQAILETMRSRCDALTREAREYLGEIHVLHDDLEKPYIEAMDFDIIAEKREVLIAKIEKLKKE